MAALFSPAQPKVKKVKTPKVNLFPEDPFYQTIIGKILKWAVSVGRHIVIFTELVVIGSFASRFILDRQLTDLNTSIIQKQAIAESYGTLEGDFRAVQKKTKDINFIFSQQGRYVVLESLSKITPPDVRYDQITLFADRLSVQGKATSNQSLSLLLDGFRRNSEFGTISITNIQSGDRRDPGISFSISVQYTIGIPQNAEIEIRR